jgi:phosphomannomutase/phosphoglucomutase
MGERQDGGRPVDATISPLIFRECDIRGVVDADLTEEAAHQVGRALGSLVREEGGSTVVVGGDCRESSARLAAQVVAGLLWSGVDVVDVGVVPTPLVYFAHQMLAADGFCMVTGSHNPPEYNGLKLGGVGGTLHGPQIRALRDRILAGRFTVGRGTARRHDLVPAYRDRVRSGVHLGGRKLRVVIDAGNGTGGVVAAPLVQALGVEVVPLYLQMNGRFPHHHPDPIIEENLRDLKDVVLAVGADLGVAYDGDADRVGVVDERGAVVWGDQLMILFARSLLASVPGATIVGEVKCSMRLFEDIEKKGGRPIMWKAGHSLIKAKMKEEGALLAGEMSGHIFFADRWYGFDDGIYSSVRLLELLSHTDKPLSALLADVPKTYNTPELRTDCPDEEKFEIVKRTRDHFSRTNQVVDVDGVRVVLPDGWGLVRASNTQPALVSRFEAVTPERLAEIKDLVLSKVEEIRSTLRR